ncbi:MAG: DNA polymerase III subunit alpha, partial [Gammaproteobacteria bacterium]|nr:DNA polymerase III subunit alpha [Gammaproteobacteria bacterium]
FAGYGFNKSHSAAYALVSYQSAWLKTHYPAEFMAAQISSDMDNTEKVVHMVNECGSMGLEVLAPNVNTGEIHFKPHGENTVNYGLGGIKGAGEAALEGVIAERKSGGHYTDLFDFCLRAGKKVNKRVLDALVRAGAFDSLHSNRKAVLDSIPMALKQAVQQIKNDEFGQNDLFGEMLSVEATGSTQLLDVAEMPEKLRLKGEKETLGLYMTGHPIDIYRQELTTLVTGNLAGLHPEKWKDRTVAGLVVELRNKVTKSGRRMGFATLDDKTARLDIVMRPELYESIKETIKVDMVVLITGEVAEDTFNGGIKMDAKTIVSLAEARVDKAKAIKLTVHEGFPQQRVAALKVLLSSYETEVTRGLPIIIDYTNSVATVQMKSHDERQFFPDDELLEALFAEGWQPEVILS